jgi:hypothetical protein
MHENGELLASWIVKQLYRQKGAQGNRGKIEGIWVTT